MASSVEFTPGYPDVERFSEAALQSVKDVIQQCGNYPSVNADDTAGNKLRQVTACQSKKILQLMSMIMKQQTIKRNIETLDLEEKLDLLADANELIMEKIGTALDEATGKKKDQVPALALVNVNSRDLIKTSWNRPTAVTNSNYRLITAKNIVRPQLQFKDKIDNSSQPFQPIIREKPNSLRPLAIIFEPTENGLMFSHPYQCELDHFHPLESSLLSAQPQSPKSVAETPLIYVDKEEQLSSLLEDLSDQLEIAIDLEHHSYRSFQGITCLMQISTRSKDYIVDTLALRCDLQLLNHVFTNPKILKVLHGADKDVEWLQRDLGLYLVNMFDTGQASRVLGLSSYSLASLLKLYCNKSNVDKQFQLADWRIRPLPDEMMLYAREDTHYLLYIYDQMKNELLSKGNANHNLLLSVFDRSKQLCAKRYEKPRFQENGYLDLYQKSKKTFNTRQLHALKQLYKWRNDTARSLDESLGYVLPNHMLLQLAEVLPREQQGIFHCCVPFPPPLRQQVGEVHRIILDARELPSIKVESQVLRSNPIRGRSDTDLDDPFFSPHDVYDDVAAIRRVDSFFRDFPVSFKAPCVTAITESSKRVAKTKKCTKIEEAALVDVTPYQRYVMMKCAEDEEEISEEKVTTSVPSAPESSKVVSEESSDDDSPIRRKKFTKRNVTEGQEPNKKLKSEIEFEAFDYDEVTFDEFKNKGKKNNKANKNFFDDKETSRFRTSKKTRAFKNRSITYSKKQK